MSLSQDALQQIRDDIAMGKPVEGWELTASNSKHTLVDHKRSAVWERALPNGEWAEVPR